MTVSFSDVATGWSGSYDTDVSGVNPPPGGLVLQRVRHLQHSFADELRLIGIRLKVEDVTPAGTVAAPRSMFLPLSDPPFHVGAINVLVPNATPFSWPAFGTTTMFRYLAEAAEVPQFDTYFRTGANHVAYGLRVDYTLPTTWFASLLPNCEMALLEVSQRYLFSRYASTPPHEPSGNLVAARCHPILKYAFTPNQAVNRTVTYQRIASIRFDYRLHLQLDQSFDTPSPMPPPLGQSAGLFADEEMVGGGVTVAGTAFSAAEKPLVNEVWSYGLWEGTPTIGPRTRYGWPSAPHAWDNVHWWGAQPPGGPMISSPGAFHAAHLHWRWGGAGSAVRGRIPEIDGSGAPSSLSQRRWAGTANRILVDPRIWPQTIRIAVTRNDGPLNPRTAGVTLESLSREDWPTLFTSLRATPADIYAGGELVLWYSTEVHSSTYFPADISEAIFPMEIRPGATFTSATSGSVFIHGIFFAHAAEPGFWSLTGTRGPIHHPRSVQGLRAAPTWYRSAT